MPDVTVESLLTNLREASTSERDKGDRFEQLIQRWLLVEPLFEQRFDIVWPWMQWPDRGNQADRGIDLVAHERNTGDLVAVQCKFYEPDHYLTKPDIDSFLSESGKNPFRSRLIVSTTDRWNSAAERAIEDQQIPVSRIGWADLLDSSVDWSQFSFTNPQVLVTRERSQIRPYQREAIQKVVAGLGEVDRGRLIMACGTGKTFTSLRLAEQQVGPGGAVLFLVPSIALLSQSLKGWSADAQVPLRTFAVCSDNKVGRSEEDMSVVDLVLPATTDPVRLAAKFAAGTGDDVMTVVFATYQSIDVVVRAQAKHGVPKFDLVICDEAHRTTGVTLAGDDESAFVRVHDAAHLKAAKRLYMTATPRIYDDNSKAKGREANAVLASMDDETVFGPEFYRLGFGEAVSGGWLTDYKVLVLTVDEGAVSRTFQQNLETGGELQIPDVARMVGCWNALAKRVGETDSFVNDPEPMTRAVAFAQSIKMSQRFADRFAEVIDTYRDALAEAGNQGGAEHQPVLATVQHIDGTMNMLRRGELIEWLKADAPATVTGTSQARILSNAKCLSEGVDVPGLDAVMFLHPRKSVVDVVQSVGRVMRLAPEKKYGYIILPIAVPAGVAPEAALADNKRFQVVWEVLQALRAHDERFDATINKIELNKHKPDAIEVFHTGPATDRDTDGSSNAHDVKTGQRTVQLALTDIDEWRDAVFAKIVTKVGSRRYWETWAKDVAQIVQRHTLRLKAILANPPEPALTDIFADFVAALRSNLNDSISDDDAIDMLSQHLVTKPVFDALFPGHAFTTRNPVAQVMQSVLELLEGNNLEAETQELEGFYESVRLRAAGIDNAAGKQKVITELYERFFKLAFPRQADALGIVYTPAEIVDFILRGVNDLLISEFGTSLSGKDVHVLDPFTGTGTFITRLLADPNLIADKDLKRKYANELHANELMLLAYYIAAANIESTYAERVNPADFTLDGGALEPFDGIVLADTFQMTEADDSLDTTVFRTNNERAERQLGLPITAIIGNPPYSVGQTSGNDNNANLKYPTLDGRIEQTYAARSNAALKRNLYDSYVRAIRWASDRIGDRGIVGLVTNGGFVDATNSDGLRKTLAEEFSSLYVFNLRGNQRTAGEQSRREGGKVFGAGSRNTVVITLLVRNPSKPPAASISYHDIGDYLSTDEKLAKLSVATVTNTDWQSLVPNPSGDWTNQRGDDFDSYFPLSEALGGAVFLEHSLGVSTNRDSWAYGFGKSRLAQAIDCSIETFNNALGSGVPGESLNVGRTIISWSRGLRHRYLRRQPLSFDDTFWRQGLYRPFSRQHLFAGEGWVEVPGRTLGWLGDRPYNRAICVLTPGGAAPFAVLGVADPPNLNVLGAGNPSQVFPRYIYPQPSRNKEEPDLGLGLAQGRYDNITDRALKTFRGWYGSAVSKDEIFEFSYGILHSPDYRALFFADLKRSLPRIPRIEEADFAAFRDAGRQLFDLHIGYEHVDPYPLTVVGDIPAGPGSGDLFSWFRVEKLKWGGKGRVKDKSTIIYNPRITVSGIPDEAHEYVLGSRSGLEWIIDRYQVKTDKASGIVNDPNDWCREVGNPRYILDLIGSVTTLSVETTRIVKSLPPLRIHAEQDWQ